MQTHHATGPVRATCRDRYLTMTSLDPGYGAAAYRSLNNLTQRTLCASVIQASDHCSEKESDDAVIRRPGLESKR